MMSAVILVQIALGSLLFLKLGTTETRLQAAFESNTPPNQTGFNYANTGNQSSTLLSHANLPNQATKSATQRLPDDHQIRLTIREELVSALDYIVETTSNSRPAEQVPVYDKIEMEYRHELALLQMESLKAQTRVSSGDLEALIGDIAKLNPENRIELFNALNRAMNTGEIKGHL